MPLTADDLRAAALSDLRQQTGSERAGMLDILLPDVPGEPFGGTATPAQRQATAEATGQPVPAFLFPGKATRPHDLRALLRAWAAAQPQTHTGPAFVQGSPTGAVRLYCPRGHLVREYTLPVLVSDLPATVSCSVSSGTDNAAGLRGTLQKLQTLDDNGRPTAAALQAQGYAVGAPEPGER